MSNESVLVLRGEKCGEIIKSIKELFGVSMQTAIETYYNSDIANLIEEGVGELHCRSNKYLATLIWDDKIKNASEGGSRFMQ